MNTELQEILTLVDRYVEQNLIKKSWVAGKDYVRYAGEYFNSDEYVAAVKTLLSGWLVMGDDSLRFEKHFPKLFEKSYGILTNSGSSANLLMMSALTSKKGYDLPKRTKVLIPIAGFPTTLNPILQVGFEPIFIDIELETLNLDLTKAEELIKQHNIKIITFAHVLGNPPNMKWIMELIKRYDLILLEDCCDALGSVYDNKPLGSFGEMSSCSFYPAHHLTGGEGGFVACKTKEQEEIVRSFREWGRQCYCVGPKANTLKCGTCKKRFNNWISAFSDEIFDHKYVYGEIGYNLKPIELQASILLQQMNKLDEIISLRKRNYQMLFNIYSKYEDFFILPRAREHSDPSWFAFPLTIKNNTLFTRNQYVDYLETNKIQTRPYFAGNIMLQPAYSHLMDINEAKNNYPNATYSMLNTFFHGVSPVITLEQIEYIGDCVDQFFKSL